MATTMSGCFRPSLLPSAADWWRLTRLIVAAIFIASLLVLPARAQDNLAAIAAQLFKLSEAELAVGPKQGDPPTRRVEHKGQLVGYLASTWDVVHSVGYSGKPIDVLFAVNRAGHITGAKLVAQNEPILMIGVTEADIDAYVSGFTGMPLAASIEAAPSWQRPPVISGASVSSGVIADGIVRSARAVAFAHGLLGGGSRAAVLRTGYKEASWTALQQDGAIVERRLTLDDVRSVLGPDAFAAAGTDGGALFAELYVALLTPPEIGQNLLGQQDYNRLVSAMGAEDHAVLIAANGLYSVKGTEWRKTGVFDRIEIRQDDKTLRLTQAGYHNVGESQAHEAPALREVGVFVVPAAAGFDATRPWRLALLVTQPGADGVELGGAFEVTYRLPPRFVVGPVGVEQPGDGQPVLWQQNWRAQIPQIILIILHLMVLSAILVFQDALARRIGLYRWVRIGFLSVTLLVLGWAIGAQLSVVHVLSFFQALRTGFQWEAFLLDPPAFILWSFVAVAMLFWGRGVFCGWLCPFGALQELLNTTARRLKIPQLEIPFGIHERLWPIKYIIFLALFAISLKSIGTAFTLSEVEPFKTAITLKFQRAWPYLGFALVLLGVGLFVERAYCRYLCPLGAALAIPARLRMFNWLKRRIQCGRECHLCAVRCTVQAIHPDGSINPNECIHCLQCQTNYFDPTTCPPLVARARRRATRQATETAT